jgi:hypothetical protein
MGCSTIFSHLSPIARKTRIESKPDWTRISSPSFGLRTLAIDQADRIASCFICRNSRDTKTPPTLISILFMLPLFSWPQSGHCQTLVPNRDQMDERPQPYALRTSAGGLSLEPRRGKLGIASISSSTLGNGRCVPCCTRIAVARFSPFTGLRPQVQVSHVLQPLQPSHSLHSSSRKRFL